MLTARDNELLLASRSLETGTFETVLSVPGMKCAGCIGKVEAGLSRLAPVVSARVNLTMKRVTVVWSDVGGVPPLEQALADLGFESHLQIKPAAQEKHHERTRLVRAMAVAGFAASNIMMLSIAVWAGAADQSRDLFHWVSAMLALPALAYAGQTFYVSAFKALRSGHVNMDVPITIGLVLTFLMSLYDTITGQAHVYFDAAVTLLFFLLIGRTLDYLMRERARGVIDGLERLVPEGADVLRPDGTSLYCALDDLKPGDLVRVAAGDRIPVDARISQGQSDVDVSLINGEAAPQTVGEGSELAAGTLNLTGPLTLEVLAPARQSFLSQMIALTEQNETSRHAYKPLVDRIAALYAPVVHVMALAAFVAWFLINQDMHRALSIAVSVLIITCPCALGLAVPMVQVMASKRLMQAGILMKDGAALERLTKVDTAIFDKTGTLTLGKIRLTNGDEIHPQDLAIASAMAQRSNHPYSRAVANYGAPSIGDLDVREVPGLGLQAEHENSLYRFGGPDWALEGASLEGGHGPVLSRDGALVSVFEFEDQLNPAAKALVRQLQASGLALEVLSGDGPEVVSRVADELGIERAQGGLLPDDKIARLVELETAGHKAVMVGDGVNDVPALSAAYVSMATANAVDIGRSAADFVFLSDDLGSVSTCRRIAQRSKQLIQQNIGFAILYNMVAIPLACLGLVTPLVAAIAMSSSSLIVVANALRLGRPERSPDASVNAPVAQTQPARFRAA